MKDWEWITEVPQERRITGAACRVQDREGVLTWNWPAGLPFVYLLGFVPGEGSEASTWELLSTGGSSDGASFGTYPPRERLKLYTREEYKANGGYRKHLDRYGSYAYRIYPGERRDGVIQVYAQQDDGNSTMFSMGKAKIHCTVKYKANWFSKGKVARMTVTPEVFVPKEALCYVKKTGAMPQSVQDGTAYPLLSDLQPGPNALPDIEIGKDDFIKLFFTDGKVYGEAFDLIHS
ncbi:hypothetical protein [Gorillibacterium timonense]|uniref:hypothetical protein n=1 Tax=Gorillibacterium timonense TaxID=1689269 RepID=UPI00071CF96C|nr:hypothetical protein [Gorillibacterium timonense]